MTFAALHFLPSPDEKIARAINHRYVTEVQLRLQRTSGFEVGKRNALAGARAE